MTWEKGQLIKSNDKSYLVVRELGEGGFGLTYLVEEIDSKKKVTIKTPNSIFSSERDYETYVRRFEGEGKTLAKINHPNVVKVIGFFEFDNVPCLVMEYIEGETLNECIRRRKYLDIDEAIECFQKLAETLKILHQDGLIHCDIHPGNIMLRQSGTVASIDPVLIDFGSAKLLQPNTKMGTTTINESFMPYEQRGGGKARETWDVYALAATLYFSVTGETPTSAINRKLFEADLIQPRQHRQDLSDWLDQAIRKGMVLEVEERSPSMEAWLELLYLQTFVPEEKRYKRRRRKRTFPWISIVFLLLGFLPTVILLYFSIATTGDWAIDLGMAYIGSIIVAGLMSLLDRSFFPFGCLLGGAVVGNLTSIGIFWGGACGLVVLMQSLMIFDGIKELYKNSAKKRR
jgi:serine/threonine protein kinase